MIMNMMIILLHTGIQQQMIILFCSRCVPYYARSLVCSQMFAFSVVRRLTYYSHHYDQITKAMALLFKKTPASKDDQLTSNKKNYHIIFITIHKKQ